MTHRKFLWAAVTACLLLSLARVAAAASATPVLEQPVYYAPAKKYFLLIDNTASGVKWQSQYPNTMKAVSSRIFHGVHGRLAIIDSPDVYEFLKRSFHPDGYTWIGLRYMCAKKQLVWSDGSVFKPGSFQAWDKRWNQDVNFCKSASMGSQEQYGPIAYDPHAGTWIAKGWGKGYVYSFVEFPTGHP
jgi:hypothetical protein